MQLQTRATIIGSSGSRNVAYRSCMLTGIYSRDSNQRNYSGIDCKPHGAELTSSGQGHGTSCPLRIPIPESFAQDLPATHKPRIVLYRALSRRQHRTIAFRIGKIKMLTVPFLGSGTVISAQIPPPGLSVATLWRPSL